MRVIEQRSSLSYLCLRQIFFPDFPEKYRYWATLGSTVLSFAQTVLNFKFFFTECYFLRPVKKFRPNVATHIIAEKSITHLVLPSARNAYLLNVQGT